MSADTSGQQLASDLRTLAQELARERDAPKEILTALSNISNELQRHVGATSDFRRLYLRTQRARGEDWGTGARLTAVVNEEIEALERDVLYLESLLDRQKLQALQEMGKQLANERRELSRLVEQYKANPDDAARQQVMQQIQQLKSRIQELMQRMAELRKGIHDEHLNNEALSEMMKEQDLGSALDDVERLMREGKADEALAKLQELGMQMDKMLEQMDGAEEDVGSEQYPELAEKFGKFMEDLKGTAEEQQKVAEQTKALRDQARAKNKDRLAERGKALKDDLLRKVQQAQQSYQKLEPERLNSRAARPLEEAQSELRNVENALKVDDFDLAAESAARAEDAARQLSAMGEQQRQLDEMFGNPPEVRQQSSQLAEKLDKDARNVEDVNRQLQSLFPPPGSQLSQQERQQLQQLGQRQQQLEQRSQGLRQQMEEMEQMAPLFGEEAGQQMEDVGRRMGEAAERMQGKDPGRGYGEQQAAMEGLRRFQQQMQQSQQGRKGGRGLPLPMGGSGAGGRQSGNGQNPRDKVELPDEDAFQAPKEFRKDLLDAMKQGAPEKYREQVKRYYEELVK
jgi:myosin heavy subunit